MLPLRNFVRHDHWHHYPQINLSLLSRKEQLVNPAIVDETNRGAEHGRYVFVVTPIPKSADGRSSANQIELFLF
jgi:hypothetical protein